MRTATFWLVLLWALLVQAQHPRLRRPDVVSLSEREEPAPMGAQLDRLQGLYTLFGRGRKRQQDGALEVEDSEVLLRGLQHFYTTIGRGRFGKRQMHIADASVVYNEMPLFGKLGEEDPWKNLAAI